MTSRAEVLFIGGRAGVGKTSVAAELHAQLAAARVRHALIEGATSTRPGRRGGNAD